jgi:hypothetical protein
VRRPEYQDRLKAGADRFDPYCNKAGIVGSYEQQGAGENIGITWISNAPAEPGTWNGMVLDGNYTQFLNGGTGGGPHEL